MKAVFLSILLVISGAFAGCLNFDDEEEPEFFGEVYWQENGVALIWERDLLYTAMPLIDGSCDEWDVILDVAGDDPMNWNGEEKDGLCVHSVMEKYVSTYNGDYFEVCNDQ